MGKRTVPEGGLQSKQFILQGMDLVEEGLTLPLWEFVELIKKETQIIQAFRKTLGKSLDVHWV